MDRDGDREPPLVSVVVPTYDRPDLLADAVESVGAQTYPEIELLVVDDASPTPAKPVVADTAPPDLEWRCLRHERNQGANAARNTGIEAASGEIVAFLDDDDRWKPAKLDAQVTAFQTHGSEIGVVLVGQEFVTEHGQTTERVPDVGRDATEGLLTDAVAGPFSTIAVRRSAIEAAGLPDERFPAWQDREWLVRLSQHCGFATISEPLTVRRFGAYDQIGDDFEAIRDVTYPLFLETHRGTAADCGCERAFVAALSTAMASEALAKGYYDDARRFALRAIRSDPRRPKPYLSLLVALGGNYTYSTAVRVKRLVDRLDGERLRRRV